MRRFFVEQTGKVNTTVVLPREEAHHIRSVLRLETGEEVELLDGSGVICLARLVLEEKNVTAIILSSRLEKENKNSDVYLCQAVLKGQKIDDLIPKCTELGVDLIQPFYSSRCQGNRDKKRGEKKILRWRRIVDASCKQCLRATRMEVEPLVDFASMIEGFGHPEEGTQYVFFWEEEQTTYLNNVSALAEAKRVVILLGPEGGFSEEEAMLARQYGWQSVSLGQRVLKADTATVTAISLIQYITGNLGV